MSFVTPIYRATATLMIEQNKARLVSIDEVYSGVSANREHYQTQAEMLKSPALAAAVIKRLDLASNPEFDPRRESGGFSAQPVRHGRQATSRVEPEQDRGGGPRGFLRRVNIEPVRLSQLVKG